MLRDQLIIFVKAPRAGFVKTRLAQHLGPAAACEVYRSLVETLLGNLASIPNVQLRFAPDDATPEIASWLQPTWSAYPQGSGDLGERLAKAFAESRAERTVVIGSDCPDVTAADIQVAFDSLATRDLVLGPAEDGGYWLIGLRNEHPALFKNITWSSSAVLKTTLAKAASLNLKIHLLRALADIDTIEDLRRYQSRSAQQ